MPSVRFQSIWAQERLKTGKGLASHCSGDGLDFLHRKQPILGYGDQEFYSECTRKKDTTLRQRKYLSMNLVSGKKY